MPAKPKELRLALVNVFVEVSAAPTRFTSYPPYAQTVVKLVSNGRCCDSPLKVFCAGRPINCWLISPKD
jgi:hypothetical protein